MYCNLQLLLYMYAHVNIYTCNMCTYMIYIYAYICVCVYVCVCVCVCARACVCAHILACMHTFSPVMANGALNHCSKVLQDLNMDGNRKFKSAHNSGRLFYTTYRHNGLYLSLYIIALNYIHTYMHSYS